MNEQTLELQVKSAADGAIKSVKMLNSSLNDTKNATDKASKSINNFGKVFTTGASLYGVKRLTTQFLKWMDLAVDRTEQLNLFNVVFKNVEKNGVKTFSTLGKEATQFQNKLNEAFGTNLTETTKFHGLFQSMGENVGIPGNYAAIMSETMTKLTYDLASLYNKSESTTGEALRAGVYAGQTKPLRSYGIDVTQQSMQPILDQLGIDRSVKEMSQAEKEILRYIATLRQAKVAMGDFANTIESPANQMKIFKQQLVESKVAMTSLFIGTFSKILPYANAFLMVVKEVSKAIASMFGIKLSDYNSGIASAEDAYVDFGDSVSGAADAVKELKRQTLGFDQINNITENKDTGSGSSGGVSGGIDQRLLDAINGYDNGMDKVRMKATEIRDKIMEWLGFHKEIDPLTGETVWKLKDGYSNLKLIGGIIGTLVGFKLVKGVTGLITGTSKLGKLLGTGGLYSTLKKIIEPIKVLGTKDGLKYIFLEGTSALKKFLPILGKVSVGLGGLVTTIAGTKGVYDSMKKMTKETEYGGEEYKKYTASVLATTGGATALGAVLGGPLGAAIGALTGVVISGTSAFFGYKQGIKELAEENVFGTISISTEQWSEILNNSGKRVTDFGAKLDSLKTNLKSYNESFEQSSSVLEVYGYKFGSLQQKISEEDSVKITNAIQTMCDSTSKMIQENTDFSLQLWGDAFSNMSTITEQEEIEILNSIMSYGEQQQTELKTAQDNITKTYDTAIAARGYLTDEEYKYIQTQLQKIRELTQNEMTKNQTEVEYLKTKFKDKNNKLNEQSYNDFKTALNNFHKEELEKIKENYNAKLQDAEKYYKTGAINEEQYTKMLKTAYDEREKDQRDLQTKIDKIQAEVYSDLVNTYNNIKNDTNAVSKETKKIIENILKGVNIEDSELRSKFKNAGLMASKSFADGFGSNSSFKLNLINGGSGGGSFADGGIFTNGRWQNITQYANGGLPSTGEMFIAREAGPELVGKIGSHTAIMNNMQIVESVKAGVYEAVATAMSQYGNNGGQIDVHVHTDEGTVVDRINQKTKQTGVCPIEIPSY